MKADLPKIWISYNRIFIQSYLPDFTREDYSELMNSKDVKEFGEWLEKNGSELLENISKISGEPWKIKEIPIYLIPDKAGVKSFSHPLVLRWGGDMEYRHLVLAHELVHINLFDKDSPDIEERCWAIGEEALKKY
jgi:hypothetical protein